MGWSASVKLSTTRLHTISGAGGQIVESTPSRPMRCYLVRKADAGSVPCSATNNETPTVLGWGFFLPDRAGSRVFLGAPAETCGLHRSASQPVLGHIPLSPGHSSLRPRSLKPARSPQRPQISSIQINGLRADESSGWIAASGGDGNAAVAFRRSLSSTTDTLQRRSTCLDWPR